MCPLTAGNTLSGHDPGYMRPAVWQRVLAALRVIGQVQWIGYGETLLHPQALDYMAEADAHGIWGSLSTNGTRLDEETCRRLGSLTHLVHVNVSIDSPHAAIYSAIRKTPLRPVLEGLSRLVRHVDTRRITVGSVAMQDNIESLADMPEMLKQFGISKYQINVLHEAKGRHFAGKLAPHDQAPFRRIHAAGAAHAVAIVVDVPDRLTTNLADDARYRASYGNRPAEGQTRRCLLPWEFPFFDKDGRVFLCSNATAKEEDCLGSLAEHDFMDIWHGTGFQDIRRRFLQASALPEPCQVCTVQALGTHQLHELRADIVSQREAAGGLVIVLRNTGTMPWAAGEIRVGTVRPRDRTSAFHTDRWLSANRVASNASPIGVGEIGTIFMPLPAERADTTEQFQLVIDGRHWIAGSAFSLRGGRAWTMQGGMQEETPLPRC